MVKPIFTSQVLRDGKIISENSTEIINPAICSKSSIEAVMPFLVDVVDRGTAINIKSKQYKIAGKTVTSLIAYPDNRHKISRPCTTITAKDQVALLQNSGREWFMGHVKARYACLSSYTTSLESATPKAWRCRLRTCVQILVC